MIPLVEALQIVSTTADVVVLNGEAPFTFAWTIDSGAFSIHTASAESTVVSAALAACDFLEGTLSVRVTDARGRSASSLTPVMYRAVKPPGGSCD